MVISLKRIIKGKVNRWKKDEEDKIKAIALEMGFSSAYALNNLAGKLDPAVAERLTEATLGNTEFYFRVASIKRDEERTLRENLRYEFYCLLDRIF